MARAEDVPVVMDRRLALVALQETPARNRSAAPVASLGFALHESAATGEATEPAATVAIVDDSATTVYTRPAVGDDPRRLYECAARLRDRLAAVRPAFARLRSVLPDARNAGAAGRRDFVELATADVMRSLVQARRSLRALAAELADLEAEGRALIAVAATSPPGSAESQGDSGRAGVVRGSRMASGDVRGTRQP